MKLPYNEIIARLSNGIDDDGFENYPIIVKLTAEGLDITQDNKKTGILDIDAFLEIEEVIKLRDFLNFALPKE